MMCCVVLCCVVSCRVVLYSVVLCWGGVGCAVLCCVVSCRVVLYCVVLCCAGLCCVVLCCGVLCCVCRMPPSHGTRGQHETKLTDRGRMVPISSATIGFSMSSALNSDRAEEIFRALGDKNEGGRGHQRKRMVRSTP